MTTIGGLFGIALAIAATIFTGHWILRPLAKEARWLNLPTRFTLSDFVWLLLLLQIVLAAVVAIAPPDLENAVPLTGLLVFFGGSATLLWVFGISSLSRAGITQPLRRGVFTVFLLPAVLLLLMATGIGFFAVVPAIPHSSDGKRTATPRECSRDRLGWLCDWIYGVGADKLVAPQSRRMGPGRKPSGDSTTTERNGADAAGSLCVSERMQASFAQ